MRIDKSRRLQSGMSLVEILVVLAIIGGVMALIAPNVFGNKQKANVRTAKIIMAKFFLFFRAARKCKQLKHFRQQLTTIIKLRKK